MDGIFSDPELQEPTKTLAKYPPPAPAGQTDLHGEPAPARRITLRLSRNRLVSDGEDERMDAGRVTRSGHAEASTRSLRSRSGNGTGSPDSLAHPLHRTTRSGRAVAATYRDDDDDDEDEDMPLALGKRRSETGTRSSRRTRNDDFIEDDGEDIESDAPYGRRSSRPRKPPPQRPKKTPRKRPRNNNEDDDFQLTGKSELSDEDSSLHDYDMTSPSPEPVRSPRRSNNRPSLKSPRGYTLRPQRRPINYEIPPPLDNDALFTASVMAAANEKNNRAPRPRTGLFRNLNHALLESNMSLPAPPPINDDSDSDDPNHQANKTSASNGNVAEGQGLIGAGGISVNDLATVAGGPANFGKVSKDSLLADTDPLGVNMSVTFDEVGGLDDHIASLKEMVTLPLLYPEIFQQFKITPPRGVLFHGPPGTGKTLLARALAASARSGGREVAFFMRKGADILSKWVGEAERQLRLLFEEARNSQPSIIFFDEIDGLAPVRSSKQDQIHASIVSTLLALMDGMDGRGQVIVIGATNRPDAVDPALRRPGRFDREFYFPLPNLSGRKRILQILTRGWPGWEGPLGEPVIHVIAEATKGYGGADLRALATEATLNAIKRTYPQIYKSSERLVVQPDTIQVIPRDFMISVKKIVASSARSSASAAAPLPTQLVPLLRNTLERVRIALNRLLPPNKPRNMLEDAEWEDDIGDDGGFHRELQVQALESQRIYRPRLLVHGESGMGQGFIGAAALHHLEGVHVQSLDLGTLFSDSTRSVEAGLVQLFTEAKRRKPSVIYIPALAAWSSALSEAARSAMRELLDSVPSTDPMVVLGVLQGDLDDLAPDIRDWFGYAPENVISLDLPSSQQRAEFFRDILAHVQRQPNQFPDAFPRRRRILPELPVAPPPPPRQPTAAEVAVQVEKDRQILVTLTARLGPVLSEIKKRYRRVTRSIQDAKEIAQFHANVGDASEALAAPAPQPAPSTMDVEIGEGHAETTAAAPPVVNHGLTNGATEPAQSIAEQVPIISAPPPTLNPEPTQITPTVPRPVPKVYDIDVDKMQFKLYDKENGYLTPSDVLNDLGRIVHNTRIEPCNMEHVFKAHQMYSDFEAIIWEPQFLQDCGRMAARVRARRAAAKADKTALETNMTEGASTKTGNDSTRINGHTSSTGDAPATERHLKRQRGGVDSSLESGSESPEGSLSKRAKLGENTMEAISSTSAQSPPAVTPQTFRPATQPSNYISQATQRPISPIIPDFTVNQNLLSNLRDKLEHGTARLTIEQLEELRAICLECVWRWRSDWDRSTMLNEMITSVNQYMLRPNVSKV